MTKGKIVDAAREGVTSEAADRIASMKKGVMGKAAEQLLEGQGWLPPLLRIEAFAPETGEVYGPPAPPAIEGEVECVTDTKGAAEDSDEMTIAAE